MRGRAAAGDIEGMTRLAEYDPPVAQRNNGTWWCAPMIGTVVTVCVLPFAVFLGMFSVMATDSCASVTDCPGTYAALYRAEWLLASSAVAAVAQWLPAYWLPPAARRLLAFVPPLLALASVANICAVNG
jgi:hypothetical protein